jgi:hypothetical protein
MSNLGSEFWIADMMIPSSTPAVTIFTTSLFVMGAANMTVPRKVKRITRIRMEFIIVELKIYLLQRCGSKTATFPPLSDGGNRWPGDSSNCDPCTVES